MVWKNEVGAVADKKAATHRYSFILQHLHFTEKRLGIQDYTRANEANLAVMQDSRWDQMQDELLALDNHGVTRIVPALVSRNDVELFSQQIDDLSFAFIAPLGAYNDNVCHDVSEAAVSSENCALELDLDTKLHHSQPPCKASCR